MGYCIGRLAGVMTSAGAVALLCASGWSAAASLPAARVVATKEQVAAFVGPYGSGNVRVVFVDGQHGVNRRLYTLDYTSVSSGLPSVVELPGTANAILPAVSHDGQWITYAVGPAWDGAGDQPSTSYLVPFSGAAAAVVVKEATSYQPRFVPNTDELTIIYGTRDGNNAFNGLGQTVMMRCPAGVPSGAEEVVFAHGSYHGGLNADHTFLCTGAQEARMVGVGTNAGAGSRRIHVVTFSKEGAADSTIPLQVCNPSASPSRVQTNTMMYLDFSYPFNDLGYLTPGIRVGETGYWAQHEIFYIGNYENEIVRHYRAPDKELFEHPEGIAGRVVWDDPRWSNHPYFGSASAHVFRRRTSSGTSNREALYLVNLKDSTYLRLIEQASTASDSANLQWSWAWVEEAAGFEEAPLWLSTTGIRTGSAVAVQRGTQLSLAGNVLTSRTALTRVTVYNLLGSLLREYSAARGSHRVVLENVPPGIWFLQVELAGAERETLRWTVR